MTASTLAPSLHARPYPEVRLAAALLGVRRALPHGPKAAWVDAITALWHDPAPRARAIAQLPPAARTLLARLLAMGSLPAPLLIHQAGPLRLPTYRHSGLPPAPHSPLERLVWVGLITPESPPGHPYTRLALPVDLVEPLREDLAALGLLSPYQAPAVPPPGLPSTLPDLLPAMAAYLSFLHQHPDLRLRGGRWLPAPALAALAHRLRQPGDPTSHARHPALAWLAFLAAGLHSQGEISAAGWDYLAAAPAAQLRRLWQGWLHAPPALRSAYRQPTCRLAAGWPALWARLLMSPPQDADWKATQVAAALLAAHPELDPYLCAHFRTLDDLEHDIADALAQMARLGALQPSPLPDGAEGDEGADASYRLTALGRWLLAPEAAPAPGWAWSTTPAALVALRSERGYAITLAHDAPPAAAARLAGYAHGGRVRDGQRRYRLTRRSVAQAAARGRGLPDLLAALHALGAAPDQPTLAALRAWHDDGWTLRLSIIPLLRVDDAAYLARLVAQPQLAAYLGPRLSPSAALWQGDPAAFVDALRQAGFFPNVTELPARPSTQPPPSPAVSSPYDVPYDAGEAGALWLAGQVMALLGRHLPLPLPAPLAALARLYAQLPAPEQAACSAALMAVETSLAALLDGQVFTPPPTPGDPARWRPLLEAAIAAQRPLEMVYFSPARNLPTRRMIRPAWLLERSGAAYVEARQELERRHRAWVEPLALRYRWCEMPDAQLIFCAWNGFWEAAPRFDPARGAGLQSFARPRVNGRLLEEARGYSGIRSDAWRIYKPVQAALEELELTAEEATSPRALARLLAQLGRAEPIAKLLAGKKPWSQERLEKAADESLLYLRHGLHPLVEDDADEDQTGACVSLHRLAVPVEETPSDEERAAWMVWLYGRACAALPSRQAARQFLALALLHEVHKLTWAEICLRLAGQPAQPAAEADWKWLWRELYLPDALPQRWTKVQALFAAAPPALNEPAVRIADSRPSAIAALRRAQHVLERQRTGQIQPEEKAQTIQLLQRIIEQARQLLMELE